MFSRGYFCLAIDLITKRHECSLLFHLSYCLFKLFRGDWSDSEPIYYWAANYAMLGDVKSSLRLLKQAVDGGYYNYPFMLTDLFFDPIRDEQGFKVIIEQARVKHLAFKAKL